MIRKHNSEGNRKPRARKWFIANVLASTLTVALGANLMAASIAAAGTETTGTAALLQSWTLSLKSLSANGQSFLNGLRLIRLGASGFHFDKQADNTTGSPAVPNPLIKCSAQTKKPAPGAVRSNI